MHKIDTSTWEEFSLSTLFNASNGDVDLQQKDINNKGNFVISSGEQNNGVIGKTDVKAKVFAKNTITIDMFGNVFYRDFDYKMVTHARVFSLNPKFEMTENIGLFIVSCLSSLKQLYSYSNMCSWAKIQDMKILLPSKEIDVPDFEYMEQYISELEQERISELEQYLLITGLNDYELTEEENIILNENKQYYSFKVSKLFDIKPTKSCSLSGDNGKTPILSNTSSNNGINKYVKEKATEIGGIITFSDTTESAKTVFYQKDDFIGFSHVQGMYPYQKDKWNEKCCLYFMTAFKKAIGNNFDYATKFNREIANNLDVILPIMTDENNNPIIDKNNVYHNKGYIPDFEYMEKYIRVQEKLAIKDVVLLKDSIIAKTKKIVNDN